MKTIAYNTLGCIWLTPKSWIVLFSTVFTLWNIWANTSTTDGGNESTNIKVTVNNAFCFETWLRIPDVNPNDS